MITMHLSLPDCCPASPANGHTHLIRSTHKKAISIHKHDDVSYGVSWCGSLACSTGWDTKVICTDAARSGLPSTVTDLRSPTVWIASGNGHCYAAAASGGIHDIAQGAMPLYTHSREPYRMAVSPEGRFIVSGDWGGGVTAYDISHQKIVATRTRLHDGLVTNIAYISSYVVTSGADGIVRLLTPYLQDVGTWRLGSPVRYLVASDGRIGAALEDGTLWIRSLRNGEERMFGLNATITSLAISQNGQTIAVGTADGEVVVINDNYEVAAIRLERGRVTCMAFNKNETITTCSPSGRILQFPTLGLHFQR